ncbi:MAG: flavin reductase, partial [Kineothrix sp.]|nr:flavin reductase [Kineothrix sp.]
ATDYCGVVSGRDVDKFKIMHLTPTKADIVKAPLIKESPVNIECIVKEVKSLGSHDMFIAQVAAVHADEKYVDVKNKFHLEDAHPIVYSHGIYMSLGRKIGTFGYSVRKRQDSRKDRK